LDQKQADTQKQALQGLQGFQGSVLDFGSAGLLSDNGLAAHWLPEYAFQRRDTSLSGKEIAARHIHSLQHAITQLQQEMQQAAFAMKFEDAARLRDLINALMLAAAAKGPGPASGLGFSAVMPAAVTKGPQNEVHEHEQKLHEAHVFSPTAVGGVGDAGAATTSVASATRLGVPDGTEVASVARKLPCGQIVHSGASAYVSIRHHTPDVSIRQHTSAYAMSPTSAHVSIRQHTPGFGRRDSSGLDMNAPPVVQAADFHCKQAEIGLMSRHVLPVFSTQAELDDWPRELRDTSSLSLPLSLQGVRHDSNTDTGSDTGTDNDTQTQQRTSSDVCASNWIPGTVQAGGRHSSPKAENARAVLVPRGRHSSPKVEIAAVDRPLSFHANSVSRDVTRLQLQDVVCVCVCVCVCECVCVCMCVYSSRTL
jgi:hypothetical protein